MAYDDLNPFAKILRHDLSAKVVYEDMYCLCLYSIAPKAKVHVLLIPKGKYIDCHDFSKNASDEEKSHMFEAISNVTDILNISNNYNLAVNNGALAGQEVFHFHIHIMSNCM